MGGGGARVWAMGQQAKPMAVKREQDFTGGVTHQISCSFVGSTGERALDERLMELAKSIPGVSDTCLLAEMLTTAVRVSRGAVEEADFKLMNRSLKEMREASEVFHPYLNFQKVSVYGSARTPVDSPEYAAARDFARKMRDVGFMSITGAGPGIMAAANEGAGRDDSFGLDITLPFEASANDFIKDDPKLIEFSYFFTRKLSFVKESSAAAAFAGGVGTMDEVFEALTLMQTGKTTVYPIVLVDAPGKGYWKAWEKFVREQLFEQGWISDYDFNLFMVTDDVNVAVKEITDFYRVFHSYRYCGDKLVMRLKSELSDEALEVLNSEFSGIYSSGSAWKSAALEEEGNEPDLMNLPRIVFRHRKGSFGLLRKFIDKVNELGS